MLSMMKQRGTKAIWLGSLSSVNRDLRQSCKALAKILCEVLRRVTWRQLPRSFHEPALKIKEINPLVMLGGRDFLASAWFTMERKLWLRISQ